MAAQLERLRQRFHTDGAPVLTFYGTPGVTYLLGGYAIDAGYTVRDNTGVTCYALSRTRRPKHVLIVFNEESGESRIPPCLSKLGLREFVRPLGSFLLPDGTRSELVAGSFASPP
jgi:hypothetical protein